MMKKQLLAILAVASMGIAVVGATPQTTFEKGQVQRDLGTWNTKASSNQSSTSDKWNFTGGATYALTDRMAVQYEYHGMNTGNVDGASRSVDAKEHELNLLYSLNKNVAVYGGWGHISIDGLDSKNIAQAGVIGKIEVAKNLDIYGKVGLGTNKTTLWEAGVGYALTKDLDINAGYRYLNTKATDNNVSFKGFIAGVSYRFGGGHEKAVAQEPYYAPVVTPTPAPTQTTTVAAKDDYYVQSIHFATDSSELMPAQNPNLTVFVNRAKENPNNTFKVVGHTDSDASADYNMALSQRRVAAVTEYARNHGVTNTLVPMYKGEADPASTNATEQGKADNRRVDIFINK